MEHDRLTGLSGSVRVGWSGRFALGETHLLDLESSNNSRDSKSSEDLESLVSLAHSLRSAENSHSWHKMLQATLLSGHNDDAVALEQREKLLNEKIPSIARITERFITRLGEKSEILPVARVKRPARRAFDRLAAHTEDWEGRTLTGPVPRRALAVTRYEEANLYENRMVVELVHPILSSALLARIRKLRRLVADLADLNPTQHVGTHLRTQRLYSFWGADVLKASETQVHGERTLAVLENLAAWTQALRGSTLSALLSGRVTGQRSLRQTNVINNDLHYRSAGEVWSAFQRPEIAAESSEDRRNRLVERHQIFDLYVLGLFVRALKSLGYQPEFDVLPRLGGTVELSGVWGKLSLSRALDGVLTLESQGVSTRFVPLVDMVAADDDNSFIAQRWRELSKEINGATVIVYLGSASAIKALADCEVAAMMSSAMDDSLSVGLHLTGIPVSPLEITSLERIARAVGLAVHIPVLAKYPPILNLEDSRMPTRLIEALDSSRIAEGALSPLFHSEGNSLALRRPLTASERQNLATSVRSLSEAARGSGWQRDYGVEIPQIQGSFDRATIFLNAVLICPTCSYQARANDVKREHDIFTVKCLTCGTRWGHERCGNCQNRIPFIEPAEELLNPEIKGPGWVERIFGQDALASPCWSRTEANRYICPACKECPLQGNIPASTCGRCWDQDQLT